MLSRCPKRGSVAFSFPDRRRKALKKTVKLQNGSLEYELTYKCIKRLNLRVHGDGSVSLSVPNGTPQQVIDAFLSAKEAWLWRAIQSRPPKASENEPGIVLFAERYPVRIETASHNEALWDGKTLTLKMKDPADSAVRQRLLGAWQQDICQRTILPLCEVWSRFFEEKGVTFPVTYTFRRMKTRWGSCHPAKGKITFNTMLVEKPLDFIEYVVVHEFAHFLHPNHSPHFYEAVAEALPDWKERKAMGKEKG